MPAVIAAKTPAEYSGIAYHPLIKKALFLPIICCVPYDYIGSKIESLLRAREVMELLVSTSAPEEAQ